MEEKESKRIADQAKTEHLQSVNARAYSKPNEKKVEKQEIVIQTATGGIKRKKVELTTYKNGVVKSRLVSVIKEKR